MLDSVQDVDNFIDAIGGIKRTNTDIARWRHRRRGFDLSLRTIILAVAVMGATATTIIVQITPQGSPSSALAVEVPETDSNQIESIIQERVTGRISRGADRVIESDIADVLTYALAQKGDDYRFGAQGPDSFDSSGLVVAAFAVVGIDLPHYTGDLADSGTQVTDPALMLPGDLIFPESGYVGIYLGDSEFIYVSGSRHMVIVTELFSFHTARRILC